MTAPTLTPSCVLCPRPLAVGQCCWRCHDHLADLLSHRAGSDYDRKRPDDPYLPPGIGWLSAAVASLDACARTRGIDQTGTAPPPRFESRSPADDHVLALRDRRTAATEEFVVLAGRRWLGHSAEQLCQLADVQVARDELRALQRHLLGVLGDGRGPRLVGLCRQLVDTEGTLLAPEQAGQGRDRAGGMWTCAAQLWAPPSAPHGDDELGPLPSVRCSACGWRYGGLSLMRMGRVEVEPVAA